MNHPPDTDWATYISQMEAVMALELNEVSEIDINPIRVDGGRADAADALVVMAAPDNQTEQ